MLEILLTCSIIALIAVSVIAAYYYGLTKTLRQSLEYFRGELPEWQSKALIKHGSTPLGYKSPERPPSDNIKVTPSVVHRAQMEAREVQREAEKPVGQPTIHTNGVGAINRNEIIEKAGEIINSTRG